MIVPVFCRLHESHAEQDPDVVVQRIRRAAERSSYCCHRRWTDALQGVEDLLGQVLVRTGKIADDQLRQALRIQRQTLQRLGNVLVKSKFISQEILGGPYSPDQSVDGDFGDPNGWAV